MGMRTLSRKELKEQKKKEEEEAAAHVSTPIDILQLIYNLPKFHFCINDMLRIKGS